MSSVKHNKVTICDSDVSNIREKLRTGRIYHCEAFDSYWLCIQITSNYHFVALGGGSFFRTSWGQYCGPKGEGYKVVIPKQLKLVPKGTCIQVITGGK